MNYQRIYEQLTAKDMIADYTEEHHIIPDCFFINRKRKGPNGWLEGNPDDPANIVRLTPEAHYTAHQLLVKMYPEHAGLIYAAQLMTVDSNGQRVNNKLYGWIKRKLSETRKGKTHSVEARAKMSAANKGKTLPAEHRAILSSANKGKTLSAEHRAKLSAAKKGKPKSADHIAKIANAKRGKLLSAETRANMSAAHTGKSKSKVICPHCNKEGGQSLMTRYHFENCKLKPLPFSM